MTVTLDGIDAGTPMGASLTAGGATFRFWAPAAKAVYLNGTFSGQALWTTDQSPEMQLTESGGYWWGFLAGAQDGDEYKFYVVGNGSSGYKRDPYARELTLDPAWPRCNCILRTGGSAYPWSDQAFVTPDYANIIVYQLHVGTYNPASPGAAGTFLDIIEKVEYLAALGINLLQPLPIDEMETYPSEGYNGADYFSPDTPYAVPPASLQPYVATINRLRAAKGAPAIDAKNVTAASDQVRAMVDCCHLYGIAVAFDVVYNHAGGFNGDDESLYFEDRQDTGSNNNSLYFTDKGWAGGLSFALWNADVRQFLINTARYYIEEFHVDGFRYDEISALVALNAGSGWSMAQDMTSTNRFIKPNLLQNAEFWPVNAAIVSPSSSGGAGFDVTQHDALRLSIRGAIQQTSFGAAAPVSMNAIAEALYPPGFPHGWQAVTCVENHDIVHDGQDLRIPALADGANHGSWYARSRSRVATALMMTAPGIPTLFMGQEFLEDKQWDENPDSALHISWSGLDAGDTSMKNHLQFTQDVCRLRWRQAALRSSFVNAFHIHDENRVIAFQRMLDEGGRDVIVVASLCDSSYYHYAIGFPSAGQWLEVFNSDAYDNWPNPQVTGNGGAIVANGPPLHGFAASAQIVIPANAVVVFARELGD